jgi:hypothetical protein
MIELRKNQTIKQTVNSSKYPFLTTVLYECIEDLKPFILEFKRVSELKMQKQWSAAVELSLACQKVIDLIEGKDHATALSLRE